MNVMKICAGCKKRKENNEFPKIRKNEEKLYAYCKECARKRNKHFYQKNRKEAIRKSIDYNKKKGFIHQKNFAKENPIKVRYYNLNSRIKGKGIKIMSMKEFLSWYDIQKQECFYCGVDDCEIKKYTEKTQYSFHLDRKNPEIGYLANNLVFACWMCNLVKTNVLTEAEMLEIAPKYIRQKHDVNKIP